MGHSIYLADDEKSIRELLHSFLASDGYTVRSFENGDALLEAFRQESIRYNKFRKLKSS